MWHLSMRYTCIRRALVASRSINAKVVQYGTGR